MIEVDERFEVPASPDVVWRMLADPYAVVGCVPGAAIVGQSDDGSLETTLTVKFGPLSIGFQGRAELQLDPAERRGTLTARGKDKQGGARFQATARFSVAASAEGVPTSSTSREALPSTPGGSAGVASKSETKSESDAAASSASATSSASAASSASATAASADGDLSAPAAPAVSVVVVRGEVDISGRLASMIEAGAGVIVKRMSSEFADCLRARCVASATTGTD